MAKKNKKADEIQEDQIPQQEILDVEVFEPEVVKPKKAKVNAPKTKLYTLDKDVTIGNKVYKKGDAYPLTEKGAKHFKFKNYIK